MAKYVIKEQEFVKLTMKAEMDFSSDKKNIRPKNKLNPPNLQEEWLRISPCAIFTVDINKRITSWNTAAELITGYSEKEMIGESCYKFAGKSCDTHCVLFDAAISESRFIKKCSIIHKNGTTLSLLKNIARTREASGDIVGGIESFIDVSHQKEIENKLVKPSTGLEKQIRDRTKILLYQNKKLEQEILARAEVEKELRHLNARLKEEVKVRKQAEKKYEEIAMEFKTLMEASSSIVWWTDADGLVNDIQKGWEKFTGQNFNEYKGAGWISAVHPEDVQNTISEWKKVIKKKGTYTIRHRLLNKMGEYRHMSVKAIPVFNKDGSVSKYIGLHTDISDELQTIRALQESEQRYELALSAAEEGVWDWFVDSGKVYYSDQWKAQLGYKPNEIQNTFGEWERLLYHEDAERMKNAVYEYTQNPKGQFIAEFRMKHKNGSLVWIKNNASSLLDNQGKLIRMFGAHTDITSLKKKEEQLIKLNNDLSISNNELEQFAYIASHDLQEPLRMVSSYTQLLAKRYKGKLDEDANDFINYAVEGASRMQVMINDLLEFSRVNSRGKLFSEVSISSVIGQVYNQLKFKIQDSKALITNTELPSIKADESQMIRLFQNLIENAIKYKGSDIPLIHISAEDKKDYWVFCVSDNGIGVNPDYLERIFEIFERLHNKQEYSGTGIGLAICKRIVERHNGKIWAESNGINGSKFYFKLPK